MTPQPLHMPFIGIALYHEDYIKVAGMLPTPSYKGALYSHTRKKVILIYAIEGYITSSKQYRWISNIKLGMETYLCVPFEHVEEFYITEHTEVTAITYQIKELSAAFNAPVITYPKIMYPAHKKEMYKQLCRYGMRLIHQRCFTLEALTAAALLMNAKVKDKYSSRELHKKVLGAYMFLCEHKARFPVKLEADALRKARIKGAAISNQKRREKTKAKILELLKEERFYKPNGKLNKTFLAKELKMSRAALYPYLKEYNVR